MSDLTPELSLARENERLRLRLIDIEDGINAALDEARALAYLLQEHTRADSPITPAIVVPAYDALIARIESAWAGVRELRNGGKA